MNDQTRKVADFQNQLLHILHVGSQPAVMKDELSRSTQEVANQAFVKDMDLDMLELAAHLVKKWGKRR